MTVTWKVVVPAPLMKGAGGVALTVKAPVAWVMTWGTLAELVVKLVLAWKDAVMEWVPTLRVDVLKCATPRH